MKDVILEEKVVLNAKRKATRQVSELYAAAAGIDRLAITEYEAAANAEIETEFAF